MISLQPKPQAKRVLDSRVKKKTRHDIFMEHLIKWKDQLEYKAAWIVESEFKKERDVY